MGRDLMAEMIDKMSTWKFTWYVKGKQEDKVDSLGHKTTYFDRQSDYFDTLIEAINWGLVQRELGTKLYWLGVGDPAGSKLERIADAFLVLGPQSEQRAQIDIVTGAYMLDDDGE